MVLSILAFVAILVINCLFWAFPCLVETCCQWVVTAQTSSLPPANTPEPPHTLQATHCHSQSLGQTVCCWSHYMLAVLPEVHFCTWWQTIWNIPVPEPHYPPPTQAPETDLVLEPPKSGFNTVRLEQVWIHCCNSVFHLLRFLKPIVWQTVEIP